MHLSRWILRHTLWGKNEMKIRLTWTSHFKIYARIDRDISILLTNFYTDLIVLILWHSLKRQRFDQCKLNCQKKKKKMGKRDFHVVQIKNELKWINFVSIQLPTSIVSDFKDDIWMTFFFSALKKCIFTVRFNYCHCRTAFDYHDDENERQKREILKSRRDRNAKD